MARTAVPRRTFPSTPESMKLVRRFVAQIAGAHPRADDAVLVADEIATNAYQHTSAPQFTVSVNVQPDTIIVTVSAQALATTVPRVCGDGVNGHEGGNGGRGLFLVEQLAREWDVKTTDGRQVVRATLPAPVRMPCAIA